MGVKWIAAVGALAVAGSALAVGAQEMRERQRAGRVDPAALKAELGLSDEQATQLRKMWVDGRKQAIRQRADLEIARIELRELTEAPVVDQKAVDAKVKAISDLQAARLKARTDQRLAMRRILSPEQQEKMKQLAREGRRHRGSGEAGPWRERRSGRPGRSSPPSGPGASAEGDEGPTLTEPRL